MSHNPMFKDFRMMIE